MRRAIIVFMALCCFLQANISYAMDIKEAVAGKTLWQELAPDRYYFGSDGVFLKQYSISTKKHKAGDVETGTWSEEDGKLCWSVTDDKNKTCYRFIEDNGGDRPWGQYDNNYWLMNEKDEAVLSWDRWMHGNLVLKPDVYQSLLNKQDIKFDAETYRASITDKIMKLPLGYVYHRDDGEAFWLDETQVEAIRQDASALKQIESHRSFKKWSLENGRHCWQSGDGVSSNNKNCAIVIDARHLYVPQAGYVQMMDDGFIRLIKPEDLISVED